jgi:hypothetical protein
MPCPKCNGRTKAGAACQHKTCKYAPKCVHHTQLRVGPSNIAGRGLFAKEAIRKNAVVSDYTLGTEPLTAAQFHAKYPSGRATHVWRHPGGTYFDAIDGSKSIAGMANRAPRGGRNNAKITGGGKLKATRAIRRGEELTVGYGPAFRV